MKQVKSENYAVHDYILKEYRYIFEEFLSIIEMEYRGLRYRFLCKDVRDLTMTNHLYMSDENDRSSVGVLVIDANKEGDIFHLFLSTGDVWFIECGEVELYREEEKQGEANVWIRV